jgi:hypothetical protein
MLIIIALVVILIFFILLVVLLHVVLFLPSLSIPASDTINVLLGKALHNPAVTNMKSIHSTPLHWNAESHAVAEVGCSSFPCLLADMITIRVLACLLKEVGNAQREHAGGFTLDIEKICGRVVVGERCPCFYYFQLWRYSLWSLSEVIDVDHLAQNHVKLWKKVCLDMHVFFFFFLKKKECPRR